MDIYHIQECIVQFEESLNKKHAASSCVYELDASLDIKKDNETPGSIIFSIREISSEGGFKEHRWVEDASYFDGIEDSKVPAVILAYLDKRFVDNFEKTK